MKKKFVWNDEKNILLKKERNISFEEIVLAIESNYLVDILKNPNEEKYPKQKIFVVNIFDYFYMIPFVENDDEIFLKTIIPSRKLTKKYTNEKK